MLLIGALNVSIGFCTYVPPGEPPQRIIPVLPEPTPSALSEVPAAVMRAFAVKYPRHIPSPKKLDATTYELSFTDGTRTRRVTYRVDGTFLGELQAPPRDELVIEPR